MKIIVAVRPFDVPIHVRGKDDSDAYPQYFKIRELHVDHLSNLCDQFRDDVFHQAGKVDPRVTAAKMAGIPHGGE